MLLAPRKSGGAEEERRRGGAEEERRRGEERPRPLGMLSVDAV